MVIISNFSPQLQSRDARGRREPAGQRTYVSRARPTAHAHVSLEVSANRLISHVSGKDSPG